MKFTFKMYRNVSTPYYYSDFATVSWHNLHMKIQFIEILIPKRNFFTILLLNIFLAYIYYFSGRHDAIRQTWRWKLAINDGKSQFIFPTEYLSKTLTWLAQL